MNRMATLLRWTEGQVYTATIGLTVALALLVFGLPGGFGGQPLAADTGNPSVPVPTAGPSSPPTVGTAAPPPPTVRPVPASTPGAPIGDAPTLPPDASGPRPTSPNAPTPEAPPDADCPPAEAARPIIDALGETGVFPDDGTMLLLEHITGCSPSDPAVLLLGVLAEFGSGLPDPGFEIPGLQLPFVEIPPAIIEAVQPLRAAIDPLCDAVGASSAVFFYGLGTWPGGVGSAVGTPIRQVLLACGQLRPG